MNVYLLYWIRLRVKIKSRKKNAQYHHLDETKNEEKKKE